MLNSPLLFTELGQVYHFYAASGVVGQGRSRRGMCEVLTAHFFSQESVLGLRDTTVFGVKDSRDRFFVICAEKRVGFRLKVALRVLLDVSY